jgi:hypothetical protein
MRQSLHEQALFNAVSGLMEAGERKSIREIRDALKGLGLLEFDLDAMELEKAREALANHRRRCVKDRDVQREIVNLVDHVVGDDDEVKDVPYYKVFRALDAKEAAQLLETEHRKLKGQSKKFFRYYDPLRKRHGAKLQRMLQFDIPERMRDQQAVEA